MGDHFELDFFKSLYKRLPNDKRVISILAEIYTHSGLIDEGLKLDQKLVRIDSTNALAHYNLACSLSLKLRFKDALSSLKESIKLGYRDFNWMLEDEDLEALRETTIFMKLKKELGLL
jgi:tetratricopeptide (TPR) repeat protein|tara:strand:+ start:1175 stop:1528 length:354 start_codon:yes stop_codon:yes gene_type:complete